MGADRVACACTVLFHKINGRLVLDRQLRKTGIIGSANICAVPAALELSAGVGLEISGIAALSPTLQSLSLRVRGLQLQGLDAMAGLHNLQNLSLHVDRGVYSVTDPAQVLKPLSMLVPPALTV